MLIFSKNRFRRRGLAVYPASDGNENKPQEVTCYGIASIYTPPDQRGKGYASHMMRLLHWVLAGRTAEYNLPEFPAEWGAPPDEVELAGKGFFSVLYSDIGSEFYTRLGPTFVDSGGWEAREPISTVWEVPPQPSNLETNSDGWTWLSKDDLSRLWAKDVEQIKRIMAAMPTPGSTLVTFIPDQGLGSSHTFRSALRLVSMHIWGVERDDGNNDQPTYAAWSVDTYPPPQTLLVTRISATKETFPYLIEKIQQAARKHGITKMEIWNLPQHLLKVAEHLGGRTFKRDEHVPAIKWYGKGDTADIKWIFNEKCVSSRRLEKYVLNLSGSVGVKCTQCTCRWIGRGHGNFSDYTVPRGLEQFLEKLRTYSIR